MQLWLQACARSLLGVPRFCLPQTSLECCHVPTPLLMRRVLHPALACCAALAGARPPARYQPCAYLMHTA